MSDKKYVRAQIVVPSTPYSAKASINEIWRENTDDRAELFLQSVDNILSENPATNILRIRTSEDRVEIIPRDILKMCQIRIQYSNYTWV